MAPPDDSYIGKLIAGRYAIVQKLNQGGMGAVYLAIQRPLDRPVALKVLLRKFADDPVSAKRFEKEARSVSKLAHPHVVTLYDFGRTESGALYIAMEYLQGQSLRDVVSAHGAVAWDRALHIMRGVTSALVAAHAASIVHRDLKPENVMLVEKSGDPDFTKVLDFGLARSTDTRGTGDTSITQQDVIPGTPAYLAPERAHGVSDDPRSDLYALGAMWFELLTGRPPFEGESSIKVILRHIHDAPVAPSTTMPAAGIPAGVDALVLQLLEKQPDKRPASAAELLERIDDMRRPRGWHVAGGGALAHNAAHDDSLRSFAAAAADLDELQFALEGEEQPLLLTRRKTLPPMPGLNQSAMISMGAMPSPFGAPSTLPGAPPPAVDADGAEPLLLVKKKPDAAATAPPAATDSSPAALHLLERKKPRMIETPVPQRRVISSIAEVSQLLAQARTARDVGELCVAFLSTRFDRAFVVDMRGGAPQVLASTGVNDPGGVPGAVVRCQSLGEMLLRKDAYYGAAIASPDWLAFFRTLGGSLPGAVFVGALKRDGKPAFFFFGDHRDMNLRPEVKDTVVLMREAAAAFSTAAG